MQKNIDGKVYDTAQSTMIATSGTLIPLTKDQANMFARCLQPGHGETSH